jgi:hypothetical protein
LALYLATIPSPPRASSLCANTISRKLDFKVKTGNRYLGGFIGEDEALNQWLGKKTKFWTVEAVTDLTLVMQAFPQADYSG